MDKRKRVTSACLNCMKKKTKCETVRPCSHCVSHKWECVSKEASKRGPRKDPTQIRKYKVTKKNKTNKKSTTKNSVSSRPSSLSPIYSYPSYPYSPLLFQGETFFYDYESTPLQVDVNSTEKDEELIEADRCIKEEVFEADRCIKDEEVFDEYIKYDEEQSEI